MPIFRLQPIVSRLGDSAWRNSPYQGPLWANARDEAEARGLATGRYEDARANVPGVTSGPSPWMDPRLVDVSEQPGGPGGQPVPNGVVMGERQI